MRTQHAAPDQSFESHAEFYRKSTYAQFPQEHRSGGSFGAKLMRVEQEPIDTIDAPVPEIVFCRADSEGRGILIDLGDGPVESGHASGEFTVTPAMTRPRTRVIDPHQITMLTIPINKLSRSMEGAGITGDATVFGRFLGRMDRSPPAARLIDRMWRLCVSPEASDDLLFDGLTLQFLSVMAGSAALSPLGSDHTEDKRIARAIDYLEAHISKSLTVAELAGVAALSPGQFARVFKATTGEAVWAFVQRRRIERARDMLRHTATPISQIAFECGFASQNHMTTLFRRHLGVTPGGFRR